MSHSPAPSPDRLGLTPLPGRGTARDVAAQVSAAIQRGDLRLGDRLPVERALAAHLRVSRMTVRRALEQLRAAGVLESRAQRGRDSGTFVRSEAIPVELLRVRRTQFAAIQDALHARRLFEPPVAVLAGARHGDGDLHSLRRVLAEQQRAAGDVARVRELDPSFHIGIARATHNEVVVVMMQTLLERLELTRDPPATDPGEAEHTIEMHSATIEAIAGGDPGVIERVMREHLGLLESAWEAHTGEHMPPWPSSSYGTLS